MKAFRTGDNRTGFCDLMDYVENGKPLNVLEIGSAYGEGTQMILERGHSVTCIDVRLPERAAEFDKVVSGYPNFRRVYKGLSHQILKNLTTQFDWIYIDADHRFPACIMDICLSWPLLVEGGYISGHDYKFEGVKEAVNLMFGKPDKVFVDSSWVVTKQKGTRND